jgi:ribosomal protein L20
MKNKVSKSLFQKLCISLINRKAASRVRGGFSQNRFEIALFRANIVVDR